MHWNHRLIEHRNSKQKDAEIWYSVHEIYYGDKGKPKMWAPAPASPRSKEEAQWIMNAFDFPVVAWVDDATWHRDENGFENYRKWKWIKPSAAPDTDTAPAG
jgi:hypothetical protein